MELVSPPREERKETGMMENILQEKAEELSEKEAQKRELRVFSWIGHHSPVKKLLLGRWLFILSDMKGFDIEKD